MNNNIRINELLGAKIFQKFVFKIENVKYDIIEKWMPNIDRKHSERCEKLLNKRLLNSTTEEEKKQLIHYYINERLTFRRELNLRENRNYHINIDNPSKFVSYIKNNRRIHVKGIVKNAILIAGSTVVLIYGENLLQTMGLVVLTYNSLEAFINFQCINLQNYNLKRFENSKDKLLKLAERRQQRDISLYSEISKVISNEFDDRNDIPSLEQIQSKITTKEELQQMRQLVLNNRPNVIAYPQKNNIKTKERK